CNDVWVVTAADSEKVKDFNVNSKAGLSYSFYGDSVALRGIVEVITDDETRKQMWQEYFTNYFPAGPTDPNYVLVHFIGKEATIWINREFAHISI
ncbi:pyridoxamine 5'-phosphate oxidase family protein, partial [Bacteroides acidifaciens]